MTADDPPRAARRVVVGFSRLPAWLAGFGDRHGAVATVASDDLVTLTGADGARAWIAVPFPPLRGRLVDHVAVDRTVGVLLVRRGGWAVGVFDGRRPVTSKVGTGYVQGTTKAGGWSQQRFARRRAGQAAALFGAAAEAAAELLPRAGLDALVCGGDRAAVDTVLADARLRDVAERRVDPWLAVPDPRQRVLLAAPDRFLAVAITLDP